ncbi:Similar to S.cerevisiae protein DOC1 (Processivity factor) [Malassezia sympodialis ATCC 42132]|uniref:Similar to S.cerevisiae protein DOC1 (Processivity factor) n=1 Tax=Malassezia sympodialis (strain ATCC 42132) TaxID=1230383 RepID=A0A1M8A883_MALS4|nr:Similar to S.cerevisiae protein DOC1 (Processivity factor) [Malassezia sympodialis ATCC 42132]
MNMPRLRDMADVYDMSTKSDVGGMEGTSWMLSSAKAQNGVQQLQSDDLDTLWQSDGSQPHSVYIHFPRRTAVTHISIYLDCLRDDSYTPTKILVRAGTHPYDLVDVRYREFVEPQGWYHFMLSGTSDMEPEEAQAARASSASMPLRAIELFVLQVNILGNHLNGKDSHIRCMKVFGPTPPGIARPPAQPEVQRIMTERLLEQGKNTHAFHRQVERVGYERAVAQLERILQQHPHAAFAQAAPTRAHTAQRSLLHLSHTLR